MNDTNLIETWEIFTSSEVQWLRPYINLCLKGESDIQAISIIDPQGTSNPDFVFTLSPGKVSNQMIYILGTDQLIPIINPKNLNDSLTKNELLKIYTGEIKNWSTIDPQNTLAEDDIKVFVYPAQSNELDLIKDYFNLTDPARLVQNYHYAVPSFTEMKNVVSKTVNSIGFISEKILDDTVKSIIILKGAEAQNIYPVTVAVQKEPEGKKLKFLNCIQKEIND